MHYILNKDLKDQTLMMAEVMKSWSEEVDDVIKLVCDDGAEYLCNRRILLLHSVLLKDILKDNNSPSPVVHVPTKYESMKHLFNLLTTGETYFAIDRSEVDEVINVAHYLGIAVQNVEVNQTVDGLGNVIVSDAQDVDECATKEEIAQFSCNICSLKFEALRDIEAHSRIHADETENNDEQSECLEDVEKEAKEATAVALSIGATNSCKICHKTYSSYDSLRRHTVTHSAVDGKPFECSVCQQRFSRKDRLNSHKKFAHTMQQIDHLSKFMDQTNAEETDNNVEPCENWENIQVDIKPEEVPAESNSCHICFKLYSTSDGLKRHALTHSAADGKPFECSVCQQRFSRKDRLNHHLKFTHSIDNNRQQIEDVSRLKISCNFCDKTFSRQDTATRHMRNFHTKVAEN